MIAAPKVEAVFVNNIPEFTRDLAKTTDEALKQMGEAYRAAVEARLRRGYKSGTFVTGKTAGSVKVSEPVSIRGDRVVHVFSKDFKTRLWEFGHRNRWTGLWERVPVWRPIAVDMGQELGSIALQSYADMKRYWNPNWKPGQGRSHMRRRQKR